MATKFVNTRYRRSAREDESSGLSLQEREAVQKIGASPGRAIVAFTRDSGAKGQLNAQLGFARSSQVNVWLARRVITGDDKCPMRISQARRAWFCVRLSGWGLITEREHMAWPSRTRGNHAAGGVCLRVAVESQCMISAHLTSCILSIVTQLINLIRRRLSVAASNPCSQGGRGRRAWDSLQLAEN